MWSFGQGAGHLVNLTVSTPPDLPPPSSSNQATAWRVIAEPPCFDALDLYDLKSHFHFLTTKKRTYLVNCKKANILRPLLSLFLPQYLISLWRQNTKKHFHFHSSMLISHLKAPSATINITAPTKRDATRRNYQQAREAICFNVECFVASNCYFFNPLTGLLWFFLNGREKCQTPLYDDVKHIMQMEKFISTITKFTLGFSDVVVLISNSERNLRNYLRLVISDLWLSWSGSVTAVYT